MRFWQVTYWLVVAAIVAGFTFGVIHGIGNGLG